MFSKKLKKITHFAILSFSKPRTLRYSYWKGLQIIERDYAQEIELVR